jgi:hypothetical protein
MAPKKADQPKKKKTTVDDKVSSSLWIYNPCAVREILTDLDSTYH